MTDQLAVLKRRLDEHERLSDERHTFYQKQFSRGEAQFEVISRQQTETVAQLHACTKAVNDMIEKTAGVVEAYKTAQGTVRGAQAFSKLMLWFATLAGSAGAIYAAVRAFWSGGPPPG